MFGGDFPQRFSQCLIPRLKTLRHKGARLMFVGTTYACLHLCGTPWEGTECNAGDPAIWAMEYPGS
jgi:hypothetical protein